MKKERTERQINKLDKTYERDQRDRSETRQISNGDQRELIQRYKTRQTQRQQKRRADKRKEDERGEEKKERRGEDRRTHNRVKEKAQ